MRAGAMQRETEKTIRGELKIAEKLYITHWRSPFAQGPHLIRSLLSLFGMNMSPG